MNLPEEDWRIFLTLDSQLRGQFLSQTNEWEDKGMVVAGFQCRLKKLKQGTLKISGNYTYGSWEKCSLIVVDHVIF